MIARTDRTAAFPFIIIRLWPQHHRDAGELQELLAALKKNRRACDEVWFCTEIDFLRLEGHERSARMTAEAARAVRALGIMPGLQIGHTLGHGINPCRDNSGAVWPRMVGEGGQRAATTPCPRSRVALDYIDRMTRAYAAWQPSSIWIDDDLRMSSHGDTEYGCFCPVCLGEFSAQQGKRKKYTRLSLLKALHGPSSGELRLAWTRFNGESLAGIASVVAKATHAVAPACRLGFQQIGHEPFLYSGPDWAPVLEALAEGSRRPAGARLGHGYYTDHSPRQVINKALMISRQIARLPGCVDQICPEVDNFNHNALGKSAHGTVVESSLDLAMGCNSLSYAILCSGNEPMAWYETLLSRIAAYRPFWEEVVWTNRGAATGGLEVRLGREQVARPLRPGEPPFAWASVNLDSITQLAALGLPLCTSEQAAGGVILHADAVDGLPDRELRAILSGGVMMDGLAALRLQERGLGKWLGARVRQIARPVPYYEQISGDSLNGEFAGRPWTCVFGNASEAFALEPEGSKARVLGHYVDRHQKNCGPSTVLLRNRLGGRVALFGYFGWEAAPSGAKRNQYLAAANWIARGFLPVWVRTPAQVMVVPRLDVRGRLVSVFLMNASIGETPALQLRLSRVVGKKARWLVPGKPAKTLSLKSRGREVFCDTPGLPSWSVACLIPE